MLATIVSESPGASVAENFPANKLIGVTRKSARAFRGKIEIPIPFVRRLGLRGIAQQIKWNCAVESGDAQPMLDRRDFHVPIACGRRAVFRGVVHQRLDRQFDRIAGAREPVHYVRRIRAGLHKNALFKQRVSQGKRPDGNGTFQMKALDVDESGRSDCLHQSSDLWPAQNRWPPYSTVSSSFASRSTRPSGGSSAATSKP